MSFPLFELAHRAAAPTFITVLPTPPFPPKNVFQSGMIRHEFLHINGNLVHRLILLSCQPISPNMAFAIFSIISSPCHIPLPSPGTEAKICVPKVASNHLQMKYSPHLNAIF